MNSKTQFLPCPDGTKLAYRHLEGKSPGVVFLGGFMSEMTGTKAAYLESHCEKLGCAYVRFDYFGHGATGGTIEQGTIGRWKQDALLVLDKLTEGPQILVGSSLGGWLMLLLAEERPNRIKGLIGIAPAQDFLEELGFLTRNQQQELKEKGICYIPPEQPGHRPYPITEQLIAESLNHSVLKKTLSITCPVRLLHGMQDTVIPWKRSLSLSEHLLSKDVIVTLIKNGDHRLATEKNLKLLGDTVSDLL